MTQEQKRQIAEMRKQSFGYAYIAKELDITQRTQLWKAWERSVDFPTLPTAGHDYYDEEEPVNDDHYRKTCRAPALDRSYDRLI